MLAAFIADAEENEACAKTNTARERQRDNGEIPNVNNEQRQSLHSTGMCAWEGAQQKVFTRRTYVAIEFCRAPLRNTGKPS